MQPPTISRRKSLGILAAILGAAVAIPLVARRLTSSLRATGHQQLPPDARPLDAALARRMSVFAGALFGHRLDERELREIGNGVLQLAALDGGWRTEFTVAADYLDGRALRRGARNFEDACDDVRDAVVDDVMRAPIGGWRSALHATVDSDERARRRTQSNVVTLLARVYRGSAPSWRRRGYTRRPGEAGDPREYTRPGKAAAC